jgi:hypothetical protein
LNPTPPLGPRSIVSYRRLETEMKALMAVLHGPRLTGPVSGATLSALENVRYRANKLCCRHADLPWFPRLDTEAPMGQADFSVLVHRLAAATRRFGEIHADQLADDSWDDWDDSGDDDEDGAARLHA